MGTACPRAPPYPTTSGQRLSPWSCQPLPSKAAAGMGFSFHSIARHSPPHRPMSKAHPALPGQPREPLAASVTLILACWPCPALLLVLEKGQPQAEVTPRHESLICGSRCKWSPAPQSRWAWARGTQSGRRSKLTHAQLVKKRLFSLWVLF